MRKMDFAGLATPAVAPVPAADPLHEEGLGLRLGPMACLSAAF